MIQELRGTGLPFETQVAVPLSYKGSPLDCGYRLDLVIDNALIVEIKSAERLLPIHTAQVLTYLRLVNIRHGLLMNFNVPFMKDGVKSILNASAPRIPDRQIVADAGASHVDGRPTGRD